MLEFFTFELPYFIIGFIFIIFAIIITKYGHLPKSAFNIGVPIFALIIFLLIVIHYKITTSRIIEVKNGFETNQVIICENRSDKSTSKVLAIKKGPWRLDGDYFIHDEIKGRFHASRCLVDNYFTGNKE